MATPALDTLCGTLSRPLGVLNAVANEVHANPPWLGPGFQLSSLLASNEHGLWPKVWYQSVQEPVQVLVQFLLHYALDGQAAVKL